jgi:predicted TIM-barrel fold metal-dependent hydrolase
VVKIPEPIKVIDSNVYFENDSDELALQPSSGMETEFKGASVLGAVASLEHGRFLPNVNLKVPFRLIVCGFATPSASESGLEQGLKEKRFQCLRVELSDDEAHSGDWYHRILKIADRYGVPVELTVMSKAGKVRSYDPAMIERLAREFPRVKLVLSHLGYPHFAQAANLCRRFSNVFVDTSVPSTMTLSYLGPQKLDQEVLAHIRPFANTPNKLLFASSWPRTGILSYVELVKQALDPKDWPKVFRENAIEVFKL